MRKVRLRKTRRESIPNLKHMNSIVEGIRAGHFPELPSHTCMLTAGAYWKYSPLC